MICQTLSVLSIIAAYAIALPQPAGDASPAAARQPAAAPEQVQDRGWPRDFEAPEHTVRIYQPQVDSWPDFDRISFRAAISVAPKGSEERTYGTILVSAATEVAFEERLVVLSNRKLEEITFPDVEPAVAEQLIAIVKSAAPPERPQTISLDRLLPEIDVSAINVRKVDVNLAPPKILSSEKPAVMVIFLGTPRFKPVPDNDLLCASNTNWDIFLDPAASKYYLLNGAVWMTTTDVEKGPWTPTTALPAGLSKLPADANWNDVRAAVPAKPAVGEVPTVFVSTEPAELIVTKGPPEMELIPGTKLMVVSNTDNDLFYNTAEKQYFMLAAGRWFKAPTLSGPWAAASASLPEDFKKIPATADNEDVLASIPGTPQANEAVIMASIPQKATVTRSEVTLNVTYNGTPDFRPIETTTMKYAYNSPFSVIAADGRYYCCQNGVWFVSPSPTGAWIVCDSVPQVIYTIPPASPLYNVTYVTVYSSTPTTVVTGYTAGYSGETVAATGAVMFGLGIVVGALIANNNDDCCWHYHYPPYRYSYGCGAVYRGPYGGYVSAGRVYGPYGGAGGYAAYNPATGAWARGGYAYGPGGAAGYRAAYNPATGNAGYRAAGVTPYGSWSRGAVTNGDDWVRGGQASGPRGSVSGIQGSGGGAAVKADGRWGNGATVAKTPEGDVYAGKNGNVYKKTDNGWQQQNGARAANQSATPQRPAQPAQTNRPAPPSQNNRPAQPTQNRSGASADQSQYLQNQSAARDRGQTNSQRTNQVRSGGGGGGRSGGGGGGRGRGR